MATEERNRIGDFNIEDFSLPPWPEDFGERLERLKEMAGLSWRELADFLGVTQRGMLKWRRGGKPSEANYWAIMELSCRVPGGFALMLYGDEEARA